MLISMYSQCINRGIPVFFTESYCTNIVDQTELSKNLMRLRQAIDKSSKVAVIHRENLRFYDNFSKEFITLINGNLDKCVVYAEGKDNSFPFTYQQHNDFCMQLQHQNKDLGKINHDKKNKDLLVLVGKNDVNRLTLVKTLESIGLLRNSYTSVNSPGDPFNCVYKLEDDHADLHKDFYKWCQTPFVPHYENSKLSVVMETNMVDESYQLSEKIYKPIMTEHPFVVLGPVGYLDFLRSYGYETFGEWIDESYDKEQDVARRISMIANACDKFLKSDVNKFYIESAPVRSRNRERFFNTQPISL